MQLLSSQTPRPNATDYFEDKSSTAHEHRDRFTGEVGGGEGKVQRVTVTIAKVQGAIVVRLFHNDMVPYTTDRPKSNGKRFIHVTSY